MSVSSPSAPPASRPAPAGAPAISIEKVTYSYGERQALEGLTLTVPTGTIFGLLGPNGSGKSTLLSLLIGRRDAAGGRIEVLGSAVTPSVRARIGVVFQEPSLDATMTVRETMALQGRLFGQPRAETERETRRLLEHMALADRADAATATLSGGMKRRLELARALLTRPELILLDEPTLALDPDSRQALWQYLVEANAGGCTLLLATNDVYEAERYCGRVALIDEGRVVAEGEPDVLKRGLRHDSVRVEWREPPGAMAREIEGWDGVGHVRVAGRTTHVTVDSASPFLTRLFQVAGERITGVQIEETTLEDVYFQIVGRGITSQQEGEGEAAQ